MGLFEDLKAAEKVESAELTTIKRRFATLNKEYQSALDMVETLKSEQIAMEDFHREELNNAIKEIHALKNAFSVVMDELRHEQKAKAAITANRNFWRRECEATAMLYKFIDEELQELKKEHENAKQQLIPVEFGSEQPVLKIAAAIGK